jgi:two-component system sensor histidine kinase UhpB
MDAGDDRAAPGPSVIRSLLRVPLFYKILIANAVIVVLGAVAGTAVTREFVRGSEGVPTVAFVGTLAAAGVAVTVLVNALILRLALTPLKLLEQTAARVQAGDLEARVPASALTDRQLERLTGTFNSMLDNLDVYRSRLREVAARALDAEEAERKRIARELHDDTAQTLAALLIRLRVLRGSEPSGARADALDQFRAELAEALERIRRFARGLRPPALDELGLVPALESHVRALEESVGLGIRMEAEPLGELLSPQAELALYRITQEALSNVLRHAEATLVELRIRQDGEQVEVRVEDNGRGFRLEEVLDEDTGGLGLFGMQERAAYVGGRVEIESEPGAGTRVRAAVPVAAYPDASLSGNPFPRPRERQQ